MTARWRVGACLATLAALSMSCQLDELLREGAAPPSHRPAQLVFTTVPLTARAGHPISPPVQVTLQDSAGQPTAGDSAITVRLGANPGQAKLAGDTAAVDSQSRIVSAFAGVVTIAIAHDGSAATNARLGGGTAAPIVNGIATFTDLSIDQTGVGYTLRASTPDLTGVTSQAFNVVL